MTKTAIENKKIETQKGMQDKELAWKSKENRKDRIHKYIQTGATIAGTLMAGKLKKNDPAWYKRYLPDLSKFTNIPTYRRLGVPFPNASYTSAGLGSEKNAAIPGILTIYYDNTVGPQSPNINEIPMNAVNQILMRSKEQVLKSNSRSSVNWEAADLGLNLFATASIITMLGEYKRLILCAQTYSATNAYEGLGFLSAYGMSDAVAAKFISELATHRKNYIILARRFNNAIVAPADLSLFMRKWYLATNVFADNTDKTRPQLYWFISNGAYELSDDGSKLLYAGKLPLVSPDSSIVTSTYNFISGLINAIVENPDFQEMYADLRSAFGDRILKVDESLDENAIIDYNIEALNREQIRNLKTLPLIARGSEGDIIACERGSGQMNIVSDVTGYLYQGVKGTTLTRNYTLTCADASEAGAALKCINHQYSGNSSRQELYNVAELSSVNGDTVLDITRFKFMAEASHAAPDIYVTVNVTD